MVEVSIVITGATLAMVAAQWVKDFVKWLTSSDCFVSVGGPSDQFTLDRRRSENTHLTPEEQYKLKRLVEQHEADKAGSA
jgi:hypothetical protein